MAAPSVPDSAQPRTTASPGPGTDSDTRPGNRDPDHAMTKETRPSVLMIDDDPTMVEVYQAFLRNEPYDVLQAENGRDGLQAIEKHAPDVILLDLGLPDIDGMEILERLSERRGSPEAVVVTANGSVNVAVEAMRSGAADFIIKPFGADRLLYTLRNVLERRQLANAVRTYKTEAGHESYGRFIGKSQLMQAVYKTIDRAAPSRATVFITGESGTGKELCAEAIHRHSPRAKRPFLAINWGAIPKDLMESEIFGHVKGAFIGATRDRDGAAAMADGGTLFLDEICDMEIDLQTKLLRFIQTGSFQKVGDNTPRSVDIRFICATNRDPLKEVEAGRFREDLYYRLHVVPIGLPPLRDRVGDVVAIARSFLASFAREEGKGFERLATEVERIICAYGWPGNVRQLENVIRNIVVLNDGDIVTPDMLPPPLDQLPPRGGCAASAAEAVPPPPLFANGAANASGAPFEAAETSGRGEPETLIVSMAMLERAAIERAIGLCGGNVPRAAHHLGISAATVYRKRAQWNKEKPAV